MVLGFALMAAGTASAQQKGLADVVLSQPAQPRPRDCNNANMIDLGLCAVADFREADKTLNAAYQKARGQCEDDRSRALLLDSQRAWLRFRDAGCEWESNLYRGGSMSSLRAVNCLTQVTRDRIHYLEHAFDP